MLARRAAERISRHRCASRAGAVRALLVRMSAARGAGDVCCVSPMPRRGTVCCAEGAGLSAAGDVCGGRTGRMGRIITTEFVNDEVADAPIRCLPPRCQSDERENGGAQTVLRAARLRRGQDRSIERERRFHRIRRCGNVVESAGPSTAGPPCSVASRNSVWSAAPSVEAICQGEDEM